MTDLRRTRCPAMRQAALDFWAEISQHAVMRFYKYTPSLTLVWLGFFLLAGSRVSAGETGGLVEILPVAGHAETRFQASEASWVKQVSSGGGVFELLPGEDGLPIWSVAGSEPFGTGRVTITLDRRSTASQLGLMVFYETDEQGDFAVQLFDGQGLAVAVDLAGNIARLSPGSEAQTLLIPLDEYPSATEIVVRRLSGSLKISQILLFPLQGPVQFEGASLREMARLLGEEISPSSPLLQRVGEEGLDTRFDEQRQEFTAESAAEAKQVLAAFNRLLVSGLDFSAQDFVRVAAEGQHDIVRLYLQAGMPAEAQNREGLSPLMAAAGTGEIRVAEVLLEHEVDINSTASIGRPALMMAVQKGEADMALFLLLSGADPNVRDTPGNTPLHQSSWWANNAAYRMSEDLLEYGADVDARNNSGRTPLMNAASAGPHHLYHVRLLLKNGADPLVQDEEGQTAMDHAIFRGGDRAGRLLEEAGGGEFRMPDSTLEQTLLSGAKLGDLAMVQNALADGANVNARDDRTALYWACINFVDARVIDTLLAAGADPDIPDAEGRTILHELAIWRSNQAMATVERLVNAGANVNVRDEKGRTPLMFLVKRRIMGVTEAFDRFLKYNPDPTLRDANGETALDMAIKAQSDLNVAIVRRYEQRWREERL